MRGEIEMRFEEWTEFNVQNVTFFEGLRNGLLGPLFGSIGFFLLFLLLLFLHSFTFILFSQI